MTTPAWSAAQNGLPGNLDATDASAQLNQFLGTHGELVVYEGSQVLTPAGGTQFTWQTPGSAVDFAQPFVLSGSNVGRVDIPVTFNGNGADLYVTLWPDNGSGAPNNLAGAPLAATRLTAAEIVNTAAATGLASGGPLATASNNTHYCTGSVNSTPWAAPAGNATGVAATSVVAVSGNYFIFLGGENIDGSFSAVVATAQFLGTNTLSLPQAQPPLPVGTLLGTATTTSEIVIHMGGILSGGANTTNVWSAAWDASTGVVGTWSAATALPQAASNGASATWNDSTVYFIGGEVSGAAVNTVYYANINNGQIGTWNSAPNYPIAVDNAIPAVIGNWLIVAGGYTNVSTNAAVANCYYAAINPADGSLGPWQTGPSLPTAVYPYASGWQAAVTPDQITIFAGQTTSSTSTYAIQALSANANGIADRWVTSTFSRNGDIVAGAFQLSSGQWQVMCPLIYAGIYLYTTLTPVPTLSVPLVATGLTNGSKYHVVLQQYQTSSDNDYLKIGILDDAALPINALVSFRNSGSWVTDTSGYAIPMTVYNTAASGQLLHTYEDEVSTNIGGSPKHSTLMYNNLNLLTGFIESTSFANNPLNSNPTFTTGVSPWTAVNGAITQSSAQTHGGFPFSGLLTPTGGFTSAYAQSELFFAKQTPFGSAQWFYVTGYFYTPTTWANFSLSVNWFDSSQTFISTSSATVSLTGATWTSVSNYFQPPATAAYAAIAPTMAGTPTSSNTLFMSDVYLVLSPETVSAFTSIAEINYPATGSPWPPLGVTQLN
jgi:hypothetical protein